MTGSVLDSASSHDQVTLAGSDEMVVFDAKHELLGEDLSAAKDQD
jgi:hypothetical protein